MNNISEAKTITDADGERLRAIRRDNINIGRLKSNETNKIKGCISYIEKKKKKQDEYKAKLERMIKENKGIYEDIYKRYEEALKELDDAALVARETTASASATEVINIEEVYLKYLTLKELDILIYFEMKEPNEII